MRLDHRFTVPAPIDEAWQVLLDLPRIAPCMPGASLTSFDGADFTGTVKVKLGPVSLTYRGKGTLTEIDEAARRVVITASGKESRGSGTAAATITATLVDDGADPGQTAVNVGTDLTITGRPAQFGRGMLADVGDRLLGQFAECLANKLGESEPESEPEAEPEAEPAPEPEAEPAAGPSGAPDSERAVGRAGPPWVGAGPDEGEEEPEPIDLLAVTGVQAAVRKYGPMVAAALGLVVLVGLVVRAIARAGRRD